MEEIKLLDCTLRDGGYYNSWDFDHALVEAYLNAMEAASVDYVELGLRVFNKEGFKGPFAYTTDDFIKNVNIPESLKIGVMVNASDIIKHPKGIEAALNELFVPAVESPVSLVRIACHYKEFESALPASTWLKEKGYVVGFNLMQIADRSETEIEQLAVIANEYPLDVLYFADSMGSLNPEQASKIITTLSRNWPGPLGIHTHDNMGYALANSLKAAQKGVTWIDGTVTGMGRGPGNAKTEYLVIEMDAHRKVPFNIIPLMNVIEKYFKPMQQHYGWGTNTYYYLAGKYGIHPTYIQEMLNDSRYNAEDLLAVIEHLKSQGGKKFSINTLEAARNFYENEPKGTWKPADIISGREVLIIGTGPGTVKHRGAIEGYIRKMNPIVIALNTQEQIDSSLIDLRAACHPVRLLTDCATHSQLPQPLITPASMLPENITQSLKDKVVFDYGISIQENTFKFDETYCVVPNSLVIAYVLAIASSGDASRILLAGFDGYGADDPRSIEVDTLFANFLNTKGTPSLVAITPTQYKLASTSVYAH